MADPAQKDGPKSSWNSLELTKIVVSAITPITIGLVGVYFSYASSKASLEQAKYAQDQRIQYERDSANRAKISQVWDDIAVEYYKMRRNWSDNSDFIAVESYDLLYKIEGQRQYFSERFAKAVISHVEAMIKVKIVGQNYVSENDRQLLEIDVKTANRLQLEVDKLLGCEFLEDGCPVEVDASVANSSQ